MNILSKIRVECRYDNKYQAAQKLIQAGFIPNWNYSNELAYVYVVSSFDTNVYKTSSDRVRCFNTLCENLNDIADVTELNTVPLMYNAPCQIVTTENTIEKIVEQTTTVHENNFTYIYTFTTTYDFISGNITTSNSSYIYNSSNGEVAETIITPNPDGTTTSYTTIENPNGTTTTSQQDYNEDGIITHDQTNITNPDGSSETHITNFDDEGNPTDGENQWIDPSGNENTQSLEYDENGDPYVTGYEIDTTNNPNGGENLTQPIDTGVLAFDGRDFDIHLKCKFYWSNIQYGSGSTATRINPILNLSGNDQNMIVNGFLIAFLSRGSSKASNTWWNFSGTAFTSNYATIMRVNKYVNDTATAVYHIQKSPGTGNNRSTGIGAAQNATGSDICIMDITCRSNVFHIGVTNNAQTLQTVCQRTNVSPFTNQDLDFGSSMFSDVTVELGHWDSVVDGVQYSFNYEVLEFDIHKL